MKRLIIMLLGILVSAPMGWAEEAKAAPAVAQPAPHRDLAAYLDELQLKLEHTAQRANQPSAAGSSVVGLRGSKEEPISKQLYWKGKVENTPVTPEEVKMFRTAVEQARAGKKDEAAASLKSFLDQYPKSGLRGDAEDTLALLAPAPLKP